MTSDVFIGFQLQLALLVNTNRSKQNCSLAISCSNTQNSNRIWCG